MVVPKRHVYSLSELNPVEYKECIKMIHIAKAILGDVYGPSVVFEHGTPGGSRLGANSIEHAHVHLLCIGATIEDIKNLDNQRQWQRLSSFSALRGSQTQPYVLFGDASGYYLTHALGLPRQYLRRRLAEYCDNQYWDWRQFPCYEMVYKELRVLGPLFADLT
jgi:hypothetical protein